MNIEVLDEDIMAGTSRKRRPQEDEPAPKKSKKAPTTLDLLERFAIDAGLGKPSEKLDKESKTLSKVEFHKRVVKFARLVLRSGVGSSVKIFNERCKEWKNVVSRNGYKHLFPSSKTKALQRLVQDADAKEARVSEYLWSAYDVSRYVVSMFSPSGNAQAAIDALGMEQGAMGKQGSQHVVIGRLELKDVAIARFLHEKFSADREKERAYVCHLRRQLRKLVDPNTVKLCTWHNGYMEANGCKKRYNHYIETVTTRGITTLSKGVVVAVTAGSNYDLARVAWPEDATGTNEAVLKRRHELLQDATIKLPVTIRIELKQCAKPAVNGKQFQMVFNKAFEHTECVGLFAFQFIGSEHELTTFAVLCIEKIESLRVAVGCKEDVEGTWSVYLKKLEWTEDGTKIVTFEFNGIFDAILEKLGKMHGGGTFKLFQGETSLADAVRWVLALPNDAVKTFYHDACSDSPDTNKGGVGEENVRTCLLAVYGKNATQLATQLVTYDKTDLSIHINDTSRSFSSKTIQMRHNNAFCLPMRHRFNGKPGTPFTMESACDVLCASASGAVLDGLVKKFSQDADAFPFAMFALFVFAKQAICGVGEHPISAECWRDSCILLRADHTPLDVARAKQVFDRAFEKNDNSISDKSSIATT